MVVTENQIHKWSMQCVSPLEQRIAQIITASLLRSGYELVRVKMMGIDGRRVLQLMIDRVDQMPITVEDCEKVSRYMSALLDVDDPIPGRYTLEVSSPGIDRPLTRVKDFIEYKGFKAKISLDVAYQGKKQWSVTLGGVQEQSGDADSDPICLFQVAEEEVTIPFHQLVRAQLILTDALIEWSAKRNLEKKAIEDNEQ